MPNGVAEEEPAAAAGPPVGLVADWLPSVVRGWLAVSKAGLTETEVAAVISSSGNAYEYERVASSLRAQWAEARIKAHDRALYPGRGDPTAYTAEETGEDTDEERDMLADAEEDVEEEERCAV